ncbi:MAG: AI-2E family transporter [Ruminococcaceae bacterium]|nr:AI-2E family transporter [Oscillospiraceae bacterium]
MNNENFKKRLSIALLCLGVILVSITYAFVLYRNQSIAGTVAKIVDILNPIILGCVFAYIMKSTCNTYEKHILNGLLKSKKRDEKKAQKTASVVSIVLTYLTWFLIISAILWIAIPQVIQSITKFVNEMVVMLPEYMDRLYQWEQEFLADNEMLRPYFDQVIIWLQNWLSTDLVPYLQSFVSTSLLPIIVSVFNSLFDIVVGLVVSVFILSGRKKIAQKSQMLLNCIFKKEKTVKAIVTEFKFADKMFSGFLEGRVLDSAIVGIIYYVVLELINVPYPALLAVICGVTNIIPFFGPFIGGFVGGVIILAADPIKLIPFIIFVFVVQFLDGYILDPHIVGGYLQLSSFAIVFAVLLCGGLWGFTGMLIGVPLFAVIYDIAKKVCCHILKKRGKYDLVIKYKKEFHKPKAASAKQKDLQQPEKALAGAAPLEEKSEIAPKEDKIAIDTSSDTE